MNSVLLIAILVLQLITTTAIVLIWRKNMADAVTLEQLDAAIADEGTSTDQLLTLTGDVATTNATTIKNLLDAIANGAKPKDLVAELTAVQAHNTAIRNAITQLQAIKDADTGADPGTPATPANLHEE